MIRIILVLIISICLVDIEYIYAKAALSDEAPSYREKGYNAQQNGDIDTAISFYQKAAVIDPDYAAPHNDLGILFETKGWLDRAESEYKRAITINPLYEKAHTNLALFYERKGEVEKAAFHWMKRYKLGTPGDTWTDEARERLEKLGLVGDISLEDLARAKERPQEQDTKGDSLWTRMFPKEKKTKRRKVTKRRPKAKSTDLRKVENRLRKLDDKLSKIEQKISGESVGIEEPLREDFSSEDILTKELEESFRLAEEKLHQRKTIDTPVPKEKPTLEESFRLAEERLKKEKARSKISLKEEPTKVSMPEDITDEDLEKAFSLAEEMLQREQSGPKEAPRPVKKEPTPKKIKPVSKAKSYYKEARDCYKNGEYSKALSLVRSAKKENPEDISLLELEEEIKNTMKEERIDDHYSEGIMYYNKDDFSSARKEFEAILGILPE